MELIAFLTDGNVLAFLLLLARIAGVLTFFPFFENPMFNPTVKGALIFYLAILFMPLIPPENYPKMDLSLFMFAIMSEIMMGFMASLVLQIVFAMLSFMGETMSFAMGFSMASAFDPMTQQNRPIVEQIIIMLAVLLLLESDMHHLFVMYMQRSLESVPLGALVMASELPAYLVDSFKNMFLVGFVMAFPIVALIMLADLIFGMIGKTNPNFNLMVIGFPVKIMIAFAVLATVIPAIILIIRREFVSAFDALQMFLR